MSEPVAALAAVKPDTNDPYAPRAHHHNEGHGRRLTAAFEALEAFPILVESRNRVMQLFAAGEPSTADVVAAVEADVALAVTVMRLANQLDGRMRGRVESAVVGVEVLSPPTVQTIVSRARTFDFFERSSMWQGIPERFRLHAVATQRAADRLARELGYESRDRLMVTSLLHDIGKLVLVYAYPGYPRQIHADARTPEERLQSERRELGVDHAVVGGVLARRWGLPKSVAAVIERHHADSTDAEASLVRLSDMLAHYVLGGAVAPSELLAVARGIGIKLPQLRSVMYDLPLPSAGNRARRIDPCPMSTREVDVLRRLAKGMVYKQIASDLGLSTSTVRTHLHNVYGKLGAMDRAQAVLIATERGWI
ncbi:MAG: HDOD domain-containing protein [Solirubrobacterales bacterium]|nr:HDOD domain-containing protein [Solirubrobacterales bacterium]MBV9715586.1 HDOD domain-containing protein [Solirubrobacterales bacterium]